VGSPPYIRHITAYQGGDRAPPLPKPAKFPKGIYITIYDTTMERVRKSGGSEEPPLGVTYGTGYSLLLSQKAVPLLLEKGKNPSNRTLGTEKRNLFMKCLWNERNIIGLTSK